MENPDQNEKDGPTTDDFMLLISPCPVPQCKDDKEMRTWGHGADGCGAPAEISSEAFVRCSVHKKASSILRWKFACKKHITEYMKGDVLGLVMAATVIRAQATGKKEKNWARKLTRSLSKLTEDDMKREEEDEKLQERFDDDSL